MRQREAGAKQFSWRVGDAHLNKYCGRADDSGARSHIALCIVLMKNENESCGNSFFKLLVGIISPFSLSLLEHGRRRVNPEGAIVMLFSLGTQRRQAQAVSRISRLLCTCQSL